MSIVTPSRLVGIGFLLFVQACIPHPVPTPPTPLPPAPVDERVLEYGPIGEMDSDSGYVKIRFDRDLVVLGPLGFLDAGEILQFDPPILGRAQWRGPDLILFGTGRLPRGTTYTATFRLPDELSGDSPFAPLVWSFTTPRPFCALFDRHPARVLLSPEAPILIECSGSISRAGLRDQVTAWAGKYPLPVEVTLLSDHAAKEPVSRDRLSDLAATFAGGRADGILVVRPRFPWPAVREIAMHLSSDLRMEEGPLGLGKDAVFVVQEVPEFKALAVSCDKSGELEAWFSMPVPPTEIARISVTPVPGKAIRRYQETVDGLKWSYRIGKSKSTEPYKVEIPGDLADEIGQTISGPERRTLVCPPQPDDVPLAYLDSVSGTPHGGLAGLLEAGKPRRISAVLSNQPSATILVASLPDTEFLRLLPELIARRAEANHDDVGGLPPVEMSDLPLTKATILATEPAVDLDRFLRAPNKVAWIEIRARNQAQAAGIYQVSPVAMQAWLSSVAGLLQVMRVSNGAPLQGVHIHRLDQRGELTLLGRTNRDGVVRLPHEEKEEDADSTEESADSIPPILVATDAHRRMLGFLDVSGERDAYVQTVDEGSLDAHFTTPRDLYAPSETVHFTAFVAATDGHSTTGFKSLPDGTTAVVELVKDGVVARTRARIDEHGKAWGALPIPASAKPGDYSLNLEILVPGEVRGQAVAAHRLKIGTHAPSDVTLALSISDAHYLLGTEVQAEFSAHFRSGGKVSLSRAEGTLSCASDGHYSPPFARLEIPIQITQGSLDRGSGRFQFIPELGEANGRQVCTFSLTVWDQASRSETATTSFLLHPTRYYLEAGVEEVPGKQAPIAIIQAWDWKHLPVAVKGLELVALGEDSLRPFGSWRFDLPNGKTRRSLTGLPDGDYALEVRGKDEDRVIKTTVHFSKREKTARELADERCHEPSEPELSLEVAGQSQVGSRMLVTLHAPANARTGLLVVERNGAQASYPLRFATGRARVSIPIQEAWFPHVVLSASAVVTSRWEPPKLLRAEQDVTIESPRRQLGVTIGAPEKAAPGDSVEVTVKVHDGLGQIPKHARIAFWAVDEGVLALTGYRVALSALRPEQVSETLYAENMSDFLQPEGLEDPNPPVECDRRARAPDVIPGQANVRGTEEYQTLRSRFETTPFFVGDLSVDSNGMAKVRFTLPHNLTTFRLTAVASAGLGETKAPVAMGTGEAMLRTSLPLLVKPVFPGKLRPGDEADALGLVQNLTGTAGDLAFSVEVVGDGGVLSQIGPAPAVERMEASDSRRLAVRLRAGKEGKAIVRWHASLREGGTLLGEDAAELPVEVAAEPKRRELVAQSGRLPAGETRHLRLPLPPSGAVWSQADFAVRFSGGLIGESEPALRALLAYPFLCAEQTASRLVALALAPDSIRRLEEKDLALVLDDLENHLAKFPFDDKEGIGFWPKSDPDLFATTWMTLALAAAHRAQLPLDDSLREQARTGLLHLLTSQPSERKIAFPPDLMALATFALVEAGGTPPEEWKTRLSAESSTASPFAKAMTLLALHAMAPSDARLRPALSRLTLGFDEGNATARILTNHDGLPTPSTVVDQAAVLWAFARAWPNHPVVAKLTQTLLSLRRGLAWDTTFENAMALFAISALGELRVGGQERISLSFGDKPLFTNATLPVAGGALSARFPLETIMPFPALAGSDKAAVTFSADRGLWYSFFLSYVPADEGSAVDHGIAVATPYRTRFGTLGSREPIKEGEIVAIDVSLRTNHDAEHVAVEVPLPAGFESYDLSFAGRAIALGPNLAPQRQLLVDNLELHPDRVRLFITRLPHGLPLHYTVYAVAKIAGTFTAPGATAEAMYAPGTRGRGLSRRVRILSVSELEREASNNAANE